MADVARRRQLVQEDIDQFDCCVTLDVNEYLIEHWPTLTFKNRKSVWTLCQNDEDFDWTSIEDQVEDKIYELADSDQSVNLGECPEESEDEDEYQLNAIRDAIRTYIAYAYDEISTDDIEEDDDLVDFLIDSIDEAINIYYDEDESEPTS